MSFNIYTRQKWKLDTFSQKELDYLKCVNHYHWCWISLHSNLNSCFMDYFKDKLYWKFISKNPKTFNNFSKEDIEKCNYLLDWGYISRYHPLGLNQISEFKDLLIKDDLFSNPTINISDLYNLFDPKLEYIEIKQCDLCYDFRITLGLICHQCKLKICKSCLIEYCTDVCVYCKSKL